MAFILCLDIHTFNHHSVQVFNRSYILHNCIIQEHNILHSLYIGVEKPFHQHTPFAQLCIIMLLLIIVCCLKKILTLLETLFLALTRVLREDFKKSVELSTNIVHIFFNFCIFSEFHEVLLQYKVIFSFINKCMPSIFFRLVHCV